MVSLSPVFQAEEEAEIGWNHIVQNNTRLSPSTEGFAPKGFDSHLHLH